MVNNLRIWYWLVVWNITFMTFPSYWELNVIIQIDELIFFRGVGIPPTRLLLEGIYPLVILQSHGKWPIEIDGWPLLNMGGSFHGELLNNQMVYHYGINIWQNHGEISNIYRGIYRDFFVVFIFWGPCRSKKNHPLDGKIMEIVPIKPLHWESDEGVGRCTIWLSGYD